MSKRPLQLASIIHRAVQSVLSGGLADPRLDAMITVTRVNVSDDLRAATILVSILPESAESRAIHALGDAARFIRREAARNVSLHRMPDLSFKLDKSVKKQTQVLAALAEIERERTPDHPHDNPPSHTSTTPDGDPV